MLYFFPCVPIACVRQVGCFALLLGGLTLAGGAQAQMVVSSTVPLRNAQAIPLNANLQLTYSQLVSPATAQNVRAFSQVAGGRKASLNFSNGAAINVNPTIDFKAGETVFVTSPATVLSASNLPSKPYVYQFTTRVGVSSGTFGGGSDPEVGSNPRRIATADIDNDGDLDLLTTNFNIPNATVSVRLNSGTGIFSGATTVAVGNLPTSVTTGDIDGDGDLDLLTAGSTISGTISVRRNNGAGVFSGNQEVNAGPTPQQAVLGDIDGDGDLDLLVPSSESDVVSVRFNDGVGNFTGNTSVPVGSRPNRAVAADLDADGDLDLVVSNFVGGTVSVRFNNGSGVFSGNQEIVVESLPSSLVVADMDGDLDLDLLTANNSNLTTVSLRRNNGSGVFGPPQLISVASGTSSLVAADVDGDGDFDLLASHPSNTVSVRLNNGSGFFSGTQEVAVGSTPASLVAADVNGDQDLDLLAVNTSSTSVSVRLNQLVAPPTMYRIRAGGGALATSLGNFSADNFYSGGSTNSTAAGIAGTTDDALYQTERYSTNGQLSYAVPIANGTYTVVLHFAEIYWRQAGQRLFDVRLEGSKVLDNYDIVAKVGPLTATTETFQVNVTDGVLNLSLSALPADGGVDQAKLSALEVLPASAAVYRLNAGGGALPTSRGLFAADQYFSAGSGAYTTSAPIVGTPDGALYQTERYSTNGVLGYAVPVPNGTYSVVLHFAEIYWTQPGQRVFDISLEGSKVRSLFDIVAKVGPLTATTETFPVTVTDGVLNLELSVPYRAGGADQAKLSGLEVLGAGGVSRVLATAARRGEGELSVYPNPGAGSFTLSCTISQAQTADLLLTDALGRLVEQQTLRLQAGANHVPMHAARLRTGLYHLTLRLADGQRLSEKVLVQP